MAKIYKVILNNTEVAVELGKDPQTLTFTLTSGKTVTLRYPGEAALTAGKKSEIDYGSLTVRRKVDKTNGKHDVTITDGTDMLTYEADNPTGTQHS